MEIKQLCSFIDCNLVADHYHSWKGVDMSKMDLTKLLYERDQLLAENADLKEACRQKQEIIDSFKASNP